MTTHRVEALCRLTVLTGLMLLAPGVSYSQNHVLQFVKQIGVGWRTDTHTGWMSFVAFSPDGKMVASDGPAAPSDTSGDLTLWSFPQGHLVRQLPDRPTTISGDWKYYAAFHGVREMKTGKLLWAGNGVDEVYAFSPDSRYVAESSASQGVHHIRVVELASGKQVSAFGKYAAFSLAISPDGVTLASGHWNVVSLWNMLTGKRVAVLRGFGRYVKGLSFSKDGKLLAAGTDFSTLQIWDMRSQTRLQSLDIEGGDVSEPAFSPDGRLVAVGVYGTGTVWLVDVGNGKILDHQKVSDLGCGSAAFSPDGRFLITPSTGGLITWPYDRGGTIRVFQVTAPQVQVKGEQ